MKLIIEGRLPGLNEYIKAERGNKYSAAKLKQDTQTLIGSYIIGMYEMPQITEPVIMHYLWVEPNTRRDKDNICFARKFIQDSLVEIGILQGDGWKHIIGFTDNFAVDKDNPRIEVEIEAAESPYEEEQDD